MNDHDSWLGRSLTRLCLSDADKNARSLSEFFGDMKGVKIVALGAPSYGSKEVEEMRNSMTKFLIEERGFTALVIEAAYAPSLKIDDHIRKGTGEARDVLLRQGYWIWDTTTTLDMINWLRNYNINVPRTAAISFHGIDIKPIRHSLDLIRQYISRMPLPHRHELIEVFQYVEALDVAIGWDRHKVSSAAIYKLVGYLTVHKEKLIKATSLGEYLSIEQHAKNVFMFVDAVSADNSMRQRYIYMKDNLDFILGSIGSEARIVIWSSNFNICRAPVEPSYSSGLAQDISLGSILADDFGTGFYALAFCFNKGGFRSRKSSVDMSHIGDVDNFALDIAREGYIEWEIAKFGEPLCGLSIRRMIEDKCDLPSWITGTRFIRSIKSGFCPDWIDSEFPEALQSVRLAEGYDGVVYLEETSAASPISR